MTLLDVAPSGVQVGDLIVERDYGRVVRVRGPRHEWDGWDVMLEGGRCVSWSRDAKPVTVVRDEPAPDVTLMPSEVTMLLGIADERDQLAATLDRHPSRSTIVPLSTLYRADARCIRALVERLTDG